MVNDIKNQVKAICEVHGAPFGGFCLSTLTSKPERASGFSQRLYVQLSDDAPGWRVKDRGGRRRGLKAALREQFPQFAIYIQAAYSRLEERDGFVIAKDDAGKVKGIQ